MKTKRNLHLFLLILGSSLLTVSSASAQVFWDTNADTPGFGTASGTWGIDAFWNTNNSGGTGTFSSTTTGAINFGNGATGLGAGTINVDGTQTATSSLTFASGSGAITLTGGTIALPAAANITVNNTTNTISSVITGGGTSITKAGAGTLVLDGTNTTATGAWQSHNGGTLIFRGAAALNNRYLRVNTGQTGTFRIESDTGLTTPAATSLGGIQTYGNATSNLQLDRLTPGSGDILLFKFAGTSNSASEMVNGSTLNVSVGPNITSGTPTFEISGANALRFVTAGTINATINADGVNVRINGFSSGSSGQIRNVTLGGSNMGSEIYGVISNASSHTYNITKVGTGRWTLSNNSNTYIGTTTINAGTLAITRTTPGTATLGTSSITFGSGGTGVLGLSKDVTVNAASAVVNLANGKILVLGTPTAASYTLLTASSITGTPVSADTLPTGYELQVIGGNELRLVDTSSATPYESWAGPGVNFGDDANGDGISNGLAFLLGATNPTANALNLLPTVTETSGGLVMTFNMLKPANRGSAALRIQHSNDLGNGDPWTTVAVPDASGGPIGGVSFLVGSGVGITNPVTATIAASEAGGTGKLFGRLEAVNP